MCNVDVNSNSNLQFLQINLKSKPQKLVTA